MRLDSVERQYTGRTDADGRIPGVCTERPYRRSAGFTLLEMLVVMTIITIITIIVITSQGSFNKTILLVNTAYDVALSIRSAETYGIGSRIAGASSNSGYGINITRGAPGSLVFFADSYPGPSASSVCHPASDPDAPDAKPGNCSYDQPYDQLISRYTLGNGVVVSDFCVQVAGAWSCSASHGSTVASLDIVFVRPNPTPFMSVNSSYSGAFPVTAACLALSSPQGGTRFVSISSAGEIRATAASCP